MWWYGLHVIFDVLYNFMYSTNTFVWRTFPFCFCMCFLGLIRIGAYEEACNSKVAMNFHLFGHLLKPLMLSGCTAEYNAFESVNNSWSSLVFEWLSWIVEILLWGYNSTILDDFVCMIMKMVIQAEELDICGMMSQRLWRVTTATIRTRTVVVGREDLWRLYPWRNDYRSFWRKEIHILGNVYRTRNIWDMVWQWYRVLRRNTIYAHCKVLCCCNQPT